MFNRTLNAAVIQSFLQLCLLLVKPLFKSLDPHSTNIKSNIILIIPALLNTAWIKYFLLRTLHLFRAFWPDTLLLLSRIQRGLAFSNRYQPSGKGGNPSPPATPHRLQRHAACHMQRRTACNACKIQNGHLGAPKWQTGSGMGSIPRFLGAPVNFL